MQLDQTIVPLTAAPVGSRLGDLFANPAVRHAVQTVVSVLVTLGTMWLSAKLGIPLPLTPPVVAAP